MSLVNELKVRILAGGEISREEALQLFEEPVEEVAMRSGRNSAGTDSTSAPSSMEKVEDALKTANSVHRALIMIQDVLRCTICCRRRIF